jgi:hypothetical protein
MSSYIRLISILLPTWEHVENRAYLYVSYSAIINMSVEQGIRLLQRQWSSISERRWKQDFFFGEPVAYFHFIRHETHIKRRLQQLWVAPGKCIPSCCLATIRRVTDPQTLLWYDTDHIKNESSNNSYIFALLVAVGTFTELLPSNDKVIQIQTHRLIGGIYEARLWDGFRYHETPILCILVQAFNSW